METNNSLFAKFRRVALKNLKRPFSSIKTSLLRNTSALFTDVSFKSASDNGAYPELALNAAMDPALFSVFRRHGAYTPILEHVTRKQGQDYIEIIRTK